MRIATTMTLIVLCSCANAASAHWTGLNLSNDEGFNDTKSYWFSGNVYGKKEPEVEKPLRTLRLCVKNLWDGSELHLERNACVAPGVHFGR